MEAALRASFRQLSSQKSLLLGKLNKEDDNLQPEDILQLKIIDSQLEAITDYINKNPE